jgi:hypothetical protein
MPSSALGIAMQRVVCGTLATEDVARIVVTSAVDETIRAISIEYGLNPEQVRKDHLERIVSKYSTCDANGCSGITARGNVCEKPALYGSTCPMHLKKHQDDPPKPNPKANKTSENVAWMQSVLASIGGGRRVEDESS